MPLTRASYCHEKVDAVNPAAMLEPSRSQAQFTAEAQPSAKVYTDRQNRGHGCNALEEQRQQRRASLALCVLGFTRI